MGWKDDPIVGAADIKPAWQNDPIIAGGQSQAQPKPTLGQRIAQDVSAIPRQLGLTGRYLAEGLASTAGIVADPIAKIINQFGTNIPSTRSTVENLLNKAGAPKPQGRIEEFVSAPSRALAGTLGFAGAGNLATKVPGAMREVGKFLSSNPALQAKSALGGSISGESLRQLNAPEWAQVAGNIGGSMLAGRGINTKAQSQNSVRDQTIAEARKAGYTIPPVQANPSLTNRALEGWSGKISTAQGASLKNQNIINDAAVKTLGLPSGVPVTKDALDVIRENAGKVYEAVANTGKITTDEAYKTALMSAAKPNAQLMQKFPQMAVKEIDDLSKGLSVGSMDGEDAVMLIRQLRNDASLNISARDPAKSALGRFQKNAAGAVEDMLGRHLEKIGDNQLLDSFKTARQTIAKTYSVENALNESTGNVIGRKLAQQLAKGKPLSGPLKGAAKASQALPRATQEVTSSMPGISPLDMAVGAIGSASMQSPAFLSYALGRPAIRSVILSKPYQKFIMGKPNYARGLLDLNPERVFGAGSSLLSR